MSIVPPTAPMRLVLVALADGWELAEYRTRMRDYAALELGRRTRRVVRPTLRGLLDRRLIRQASPNSERATFELTQAGKAYVESFSPTPYRPEAEG